MGICREPRCVVVVVLMMMEEVGILAGGFGRGGLCAAGARAPVTSPDSFKFAPSALLRSVVLPAVI